MFRFLFENYSYHQMFSSIVSHVFYILFNTEIIELASILFLNLMFRSVDYFLKAPNVLGEKHM